MSCPGSAVAFCVLTWRAWRIRRTGRRAPWSDPGITQPFPGDQVLALLDLGVIELLDLAAAGADEVVVALTFVEFS